MPNRWPISSGNWSNAAIWSGSIIPTASDDVFANSQSIYIDTDITVRSLQNTSGTGISSSGVFYLNNGVNVNVTSFIQSAFLQTLIIISASNSASINCPSMTAANSTAVLMQTSSSLNYTGSVFNDGVGAGINHGSVGILNLLGNVTTGNGNGSTGIVLSNRGTLNIRGNVTGGPSSTQQSIIVYSSCSINIIGNVIGGTGAGGVAITLGINGNNGNNRLIINGNVIGNGSSGILPAFGTADTIIITGSLIDNGTSAYRDNSFASGTNLTVTGSVIGTRSTTANINKTTGGGTITVIGPVYAGLLAPAISSTVTVFATGPFYNNNNRNAVFAQNLQLLSGSTPTWTFDTETYTEQRTLYTQNYPGNFPAASNVRQGTVFGDTAQFTGTVAIPPTGSVLKGVPVDNTTGSASFTTQSVWGIDTNNLTTTGSLGARLRNVATVAVTGDAIASKGNL